ncbi:MAG: hypothetical protein EXR93_05585 [Gemmatimonadetes bacterium]|nr:hypothetical protein [Gemmatimonadota bacterium]
MKTSRQAALLSFALVSLAGCAHSTRAAGTTGVASINRNFCPKPSATLYVTNDNWLDMVIYVYRGSSRVRVGEVTGVQSAVFEIPESVMGGGTTFQVFADPIGSFSSNGSPNGFATGAIGMSTGHLIIDLRVANVLDQSSYSYGVESIEDS